jgi:hypothetical protein
VRKRGTNSGVLAVLDRDAKIPLHRQIETSARDSIRAGRLPGSGPGRTGGSVSGRQPLACLSLCCRIVLPDQGSHVRVAAIRFAVTVRRAIPAPARSRTRCHERPARPGPAGAPPPACPPARLASRRRYPRVCGLNPARRRTPQAVLAAFVRASDATGVLPQLSRHVRTSGGSGQHARSPYRMARQSGH